MTEWAGWACDRSQTEITRVVNALITDTVRTPSQQVVTQKSVATVLLAMNSDLDASDLAQELKFDHGLFLAEPSLIPGVDRLTLSEKGLRVAEEFRQAAPRRVRGPAGRRAVLLCLDERVTGVMVDLSEMLGEPHSWFYGTQFTTDELSDAAINLQGRGYIEALTPWNGPVLRAKLTPKGRSCVELYSGDPDQMENPVISGHQFNFGSYTQQGGNTAFGAPVGVQNSTTVVSNGQAATQLLEILQALDRQGAIPLEQQAEAGNVSADLQTALSEQAEPADLWHRVGSFFQRLNAHANGNTAISLLVVTGLNVAAMKAGLGTPS